MRKPDLPVQPLAFSIKTLSAACDLGETLLRQAIKAGELKTYHVVVDGSRRKSIRIKPSDAQAFIDNALVAVDDEDGQKAAA